MVRGVEKILVYGRGEKILGVWGRGRYAGMVYIYIGGEVWVVDTWVLVLGVGIHPHPYAPLIFACEIKDYHKYRYKTLIVILL